MQSFAFLSLCHQLDSLHLRKSYWIAPLAHSTQYTTDSPQNHSSDSMPFSLPHVIPSKDPAWIYEDNQHSKRFKPSIYTIAHWYQWKPYNRQNMIITKFLWTNNPTTNILSFTNKLNLKISQTHPFFLLSQSKYVEIFLDQVDFTSS